MIPLRAVFIDVNPKEPRRVPFRFYVPDADHAAITDIVEGSVRYLGAAGDISPFVMGCDQDDVSDEAD